ncbi:MAG: pirin family protein [Deltaproteobacteria bacterium]|nr:pirin family protein [Deltaproteobacteria bacterium]
MELVEAVIAARARDLGGVVVDRVLPAIGRKAIGPFLFLDHMGPTETALTVRPHPHIHLATVTYLFEGAIMHRDSLGSVQLITPGAINWMVAGKGIVHSERPPETPGRLHGLQIWVGLPSALEDSAPSFVHTPAEAMPVVARPGARIRVLAGSAFGATSPVVTQSPLFYADLELDAGAELELPAEYAERAVYVVDGSINVGGATDLAARHLAVLTAGSVAPIRALTPARAVVFGGEPLDGMRHMWWNFVSSSRERIAAAADDWRNRRFPHIPDDDTDLIPAPAGP